MTLQNSLQGAKAEQLHVFSLFNVVQTKFVSTLGFFKKLVLYNLSYKLINIEGESYPQHVLHFYELIVHHT